MQEPLDSSLSDPSVPHADSQSHADSTPCLACGFPDPRFSRTILSPFCSTYPFDYSPRACQLARNVVKDGESEMRLLQQAMERLQARMDDVSNVVLQHRAYIAPIGHLPDDVLVLIFEEASRNDLGDPIPPWIFSAVCKHWREVAISSANLWTNIAFTSADIMYPDPSFESAISLRQERIQLQLLRSGSCPLAIDIELGPHPSTVAPVEEILQTLFSHVDRYSRLVISGEFDPSQLVFDANPSPIFAMLEKLIIWGNSSRSSDAAYATFFKNAPILTNLELYNCDQLSAMPQVLFSNLRLIRINGSIYTSQDLHRVLQSCPHLQDLDVSHVVDDDSTTDDLSFATFPVIVLAELRSLRFSQQPASTLSHVLTSYLRAPHLKALDVYNLQDPDLIAISCFLDVSDCTASLEELVLERGNFSSFEALSSLLPSLKALRSLSINLGGSSEGADFDIDPVLTALAKTFQSLDDRHSPAEETLTRICPRLIKLSFTSVLFTSRLLHALVYPRVVGPDQLASCRLEEVKLENVEWMDRSAECDLRWLEEMGEKGLLKVSQVNSM